MIHFKKSLNKLIYTLVGVLFLLPLSTFAQEGGFIKPIGGVNFSRFLNTLDIYSQNQGSNNDKISLLDTYRPLAGVDFIYNFDESYGLQTGLIYSGNGQNYTGFVAVDANPLTAKNGTTYYDSNVNFKSQLHLSYIKLPIAIRFNSPQEIRGRVNVSIWLGAQVSYLLNVDAASTSPQTTSTVLLPSPDPYKLFSTWTFGIVMGAEINVKITNKLYIHTGMRFDRDFTDAENKAFYTDMSDAQYTDYTKTHQAEAVFPVALKKSTLPAKADFFTRNPTLNSTIGIYMGLGIKIFHVDKRVIEKE
jgi:hypothetical protein